ncbi:MAG: VPLPA-CTERM sorting domain-containing protein [Chromatiales bacterium]|nr:VPLPA-CTERM sorting domain-containing protein [Chromatiales bacterium]
MTFNAVTESSTRMKIRQLTAALLLVAAAGTAQAASLALVPSAGTVAPNGAFTVDLVLNAADAPGAHPGLHGGQIVVDFNQTLLTYGSFTLASGLNFFSSPVVATNGNTRTVTFGFENAPDSGTVGTFSFTATGPVGSLATIGLVDADDFSGSFANYVPAYQRFYPDFAGAQVNIVPLPAGIWLLGTGVAALAARRRFQRAAA